MNILITYKCEKNCSFCFCEKSNEFMSLENYKKIIKKIDSFETIDEIGILGGEPTLHPDWLEMVERACYRFKIVKLFSNLSGNNIEKLKKYDNLYIVWNNAEPDLIDIQLREKMYNNFYEHIITKYDFHHIIMSVTLNNYKTLSEFDYLIDLYKKHDIFRIRLAISIYSQELYKNNGSGYYNVVKYLIDNGLLISNDPCGHPYLCSFTEKQINFLNVRNVLKKNKDCYGGCDILTDGTIIPCMPFMPQKDSTFNILDQNNVDSIREQIKLKYKWNTCERKINTFECNNCYGRCPAL